MDQTKIKDIIKESSMKMTGDIMKKLIKNLDVGDDEEKIQSVIQRYLEGKTKEAIKLDIIFNENRIESLPASFELLGADMKTVKCIKIDNIVLMEDIIDDFIDYVFGEIGWIGQEKHSVTH